jgi:ferric-dicitrate binding protein FerR (iron transport regulator)
MMSVNTQDTIPPIEQAVGWALAHEDGESPSSPEFRSWLERSPANTSLYNQVVALLERLKRLDPEHNIDVEDLIARASTEEDIAEVP